MINKNSMEEKMKILHRKTVLLTCLLVVAALPPMMPQAAAPPDTVEASTRCPVCGMFVAKYPLWVTRIEHTDGTIKTFDGVKDMMTYFFNPEHFGPSSRESIEKIWVKDYYTLEWLDGRQAYYVTGSDTYGPMGHEFIPFASKEAAESFRQDHHGEKVLSFAEISEPLVEALRAGQKMKQ
jgi:nitrous oxide reductase accessory protein NosL